jgi:hypothetical protein
MPRLLIVLATLVLAATAHAETDGSSFRERADYFDAVTQAQKFLDCVELSANADEDPAAVEAAATCFRAVLSDDFVNTIDGVAGTRNFPDPESFIQFAVGPADLVRENVTVQAGVYTTLGFSERRPRSVRIRTLLSVFQRAVLPSPAFGDQLGGQIVRGRLFFEVTELRPNVWEITRSRFSVLEIISGVDFLSLPRPTAADDF